MATIRASQYLLRPTARRGLRQFSSTATRAAADVKTIGVVGAGQMGLGIALVAAQRAGVPVTIIDSSQASIDKGLSFAGEAGYEDQSEMPC
jgi:3-hydroxybutyryl-CoA dehydrogenase